MEFVDVNLGNEIGKVGGGMEREEGGERGGKRRGRRRRKEIKGKKRKMDGWMEWMG